MVPKSELLAGAAREFSIHCRKANTLQAAIVAEKGRAKKASQREFEHEDALRKSARSDFELRAEQTPGTYPLVDFQYTLPDLKKMYGLGLEFFLV